MTHQAELTFDATEEATLEVITRSLRADGWAEHVTVQRLLRTWRDLAIEVDRYVLTIDDYTNDLTARDGLEIALARCDEPLRSRLKRAIATADADFVARTVNDTEQTLGRYCGIQPKSGWWWKRRPNGGPLAEYLTGSP